MRLSKEYAQLLCDRFYIRYKATAKLIILCTVCAVTKKIVPACLQDDEYNYHFDYFVCDECKKYNYDHSD